MKRQTQPMAQQLTQTLVSIGLGTWIIACVAGALALAVAMGLAERLIGATSSAKSLRPAR